MAAKEDEEVSQAAKAYEKKLKLNSEFVNRRSWVQVPPPAPIHTWPGATNKHRAILFLAAISY
jgi:hypothetical protein